MKTFITLLIFIPALCFGGENLIFDASLQQGTEAEIVLSDDQKTSVRFLLRGLSTETVTLNGKGYTKILPLESEVTDFGFIAEEGFPDLPVYSSMVIIPDQTGVRANILSFEYETYEDIEIPPFQPFELESGEEEISFVINESFYNQDRFYPEEIVEAGEPMIMRDFRFVQTVINPVQYNPVTKQMRVYTSVNYELLYEGFDDRNVKFRTDNSISEAFLTLYKVLFDNAEEILTEYTAERGGYLIITADAYADSAELMGRWKHLKGYYTEIITASDIDASGAPSNTQVKNTIQNAYDTWVPKPEYVLIIGDVSGDSPSYNIAGYTHEGNITDHTYSLLEGSDVEPDLFIARMSVSSMAEFRSILHKTLKYETNPDMSDPLYLKRGLCVAGSYLSTITPRLMALWVRQRMLDYGFVHVDTVIYTGASRITDAINDGMSLVTYRGAAGTSGWWNPYWGTSDIDALTNGWKLGVMPSISCGTGNFGVDRCFGEAWITAGTATNPKGGVGFYGPSHGNTATAWNNTILTGLTAALLEDGNYHLGPVLVAGKQQAKLTYPRVSGSGGWSWYYHIYNTLGDPELSIRTDTPQSMTTVNYLETIPVGTNFLSFNVTGSDGSPLEGAYVNLVKGYGIGEEIFKGGWTNTDGNLTIDFQNGTADTIFVTISYRNYIPHMGYCRVLAQPVALGVDSLVIDDDDIGGSSGNDDGNVNPHETLGLNIRLKNFGSMLTATGIDAYLTSLDPRINITTSHQTYPNIAPGGDAYADGQFIVELGADIPHDENILINLSITADGDNSWNGVILLEINSIRPVSIETSYPGNPNSRLDPGETSDMVISFENAGELGGDNISGTLTCGDSYITIIDGSGYFGNIGIDGTGDNSSDPFAVEVSDEAYDGRNINFTINFTANMTDMEDVEFEKTFSIVIGQVDSYDPVGPDNYGYYMYDNTDLSYDLAPIYGWVEINPNFGGSGTSLSFPDNNDASSLTTVPFDFKYYGETYSYIIVSINGFISPDTVHIDAGGNYWYYMYNYSIPDPGNARAQISPFWDDLQYSGSPNGVYKYYDSGNNRFIIEWSGLTHVNTYSTETFQLIIYDPYAYPTPTGDCEIVFQYHTINNNDIGSPPRYAEAYSTVGLENWDEDDGLQYEYDNVYHPGAAVLQNGRAIKITTATGAAVLPAMSYSPESFSLSCQPGSQAQGELTISNNGEGILFYSITPEASGILTLSIDGQNTVSLPVEISIEKSKKSEQVPVVSRAKGDDFDGEYNPPMTLDSGGPDNFGYTWRDSDEPGGPTYNWIDISSIGTPINWEGDIDDGIVIGLPIGFDFSFYDNFYNSINICTNGFASFTSTSTGYNNTSIPYSAEPNNMLAIYWDDLNFEGGGSAYIYTNSIDTCIISYIGVPHYNGGSFTFEAILLASGRIVYQYQEATGYYVNLETIGIENLAGNDGLQVVYNAPYVTPGLAIEFMPPAPDWLTVDPSSGSVEPYASDIITVTCDASELEEGLYEGALHMQTNDPNYPSTSIPVTFNVLNALLGSIAGTVTDVFSRNPVEGATVNLWQGEIFVGTDYTLSDGTYLFNGLEAGLYDVEFIADGYFDDVVEGAEALEGEVTIVDMVLHAPGYYSGIVTGESSPLEGVSVDAVLQRGMISINGNIPLDDNPVTLDVTPVLSDVTDEFGQYVLVLEPGTYDITYAKTDWVTEVITDVVISLDDILTDNDVDLIPVVTGYEYMPGDCNMALGLWPPQVIGGDVTYLVGYFIGSGNAPCELDDFWASADISGDCQVIGGDVSALVGYLIGTNPEILFCPDYTPVWPPIPDNSPSGWPNCDTPVISSKIVPTGSVK